MPRQKSGAPALARPKRGGAGPLPGGRLPASGKKSLKKIPPPLLTNPKKCDINALNR